MGYKNGTSWQFGPNHHLYQLSTRLPPALQAQLYVIMTSYLPVISLLVLLLLSTPGFDAASMRASSQHLCGAHLVDALYLVCGDNGFFYGPKDKRDLEPQLGLLSPKSSQENEVDDFPYLGLGELKVKRGIVEQCCHKPCSIFDLQNYCN